VQDDRAGEAGEKGRGLGVGIAVVHHDRLAERGGELELRDEKVSLRLPRSPVTVEIEARLADRDGALVPKQLGKLVEPPRLRTAGLVRVNAERGEDAVLAFCDRERRAAGIDSRADCDDTLDAGLASAREQFVRSLVAPVEVRVGFDRATAVSSSTRGKSGSAAAMPSAGTVRP
jgi:hypothetical protein